jgi:small subunit ribosomal protein S13
MRIAGVEIPAEKRTEIALTYIYGIGRKNVTRILKEANIDPNKRAKDLNEQEVARIQKAISVIPTEGALKKIISENIKRLKQIGAYRGMRHSARLPVRGQRTRSNARTKRGKRVTIGAMKKEDMQKQVTAEKDKT